MELANIVVIGLGPSAIDLIHCLKSKLPPTHRIVVIEQHEYAFWPIASLRASIVPAWEDRLILPLDSQTPAWLGKPHVILSGTKAVELRNHAVRVTYSGSDMSLGFGFGEWIAWEQLVIATGTSYPFPCRPCPSCPSVQGIKSLFRETQRQIREAQHVLIIGGGPVAIEFAGEVTSYYPAPAKRVTLITGSSSLLSPTFDTKPALPNSLLRQLQERGVRVIFGQTVDVSGFRTGTVYDKTFTTTNGERISPDFIFLATGNRASATSSSLLKSLRPDILTPSGRIQVSETLMLHDTDEPIYAMGDACDTPEVKTYANASRHAPIIAHNILSRLNMPSGRSTSLSMNRPKQGPSGKPKTWKDSSVIMAVTIGPKGGAGSIFGVNIGPWMTSKIKGTGLFITDWRKKLGDR